MLLRTRTLPKSQRTFPVLASPVVLAFPADSEDEEEEGDASRAEPEPEGWVVSTMG